VTHTDLAKRAATARAAQMRQVTDRPQQRRGAADLGAVACARGSVLAFEERKKGDATVSVVTGYASVTEAPYDMYDFFGPYTEVVTRGAFEATLSRSPLVEFTVNHGAGGGLPMAHTRNDTLVLTEDETGLRYEATVDPTRSDVADMLKALERGDLAEASFKFRIDSGQWSPDYEEFRINAVDLERGDVSAVNFGANPAASSGVRADEEPAATRETASPADLRAQLLALALADD
jgi:HK97 family phage prohead protease